MNSTLSLSFRMEILAITLVGWLFIYFLINRRKVDDQQRLDFGTELDRKTPFWPFFSLVYFSTYIFVIQPFFTLTDPHQFYIMLTSFIAITIASSLIHAAIPSKIQRVENVPNDGIPGRLLELFQKTCKPYGNFPSMHVGLSVSVVAANFMSGNLAIGFFSLIWGILIALSTLFTKQHYIIDVLAGLIGGTVIWTLVFTMS